MPVHMKRVFAVLLVVSVISLVIGSGGGAAMSTIRGSGKVVTQQRAVSGFDRLDVSGIGTVVLTQGTTTSLTVEAEDNIIGHLTTEVAGGTLKIGVRAGVSESLSPTKPIRYLLTVPKLNGVTLSGVVALDAGPLRADTFDLDLSGTGGAKLADLRASTLTVNISGAAGVMIAGQVTRQTVEIGGAGSYAARGLASATATVGISGAGSATIAVRDTLTATISGAGSIRYAGNPRLTQHISGAGSIQQIS